MAQEPDGTAPAWDAEVDAVGLLCPLPVLRARKRLAGMAPGSVLRLLATDPAALVDVPHFCAESGHVLLAVETGIEGVGSGGAGPTRAFLIRRA